MGETVKKRKALAVLECFEEIPCNPCESSCPHKAITLNGAIWHVPELIEERCVGCGICVAHCSGQAIFVVDDSYSDELCAVSMPYEFWPLPEKGCKVTATDRDGMEVCEGTVKKVVTAPSFDATAVLTVEVPLQYKDIVRGIRRNKG